MKGLDEKVIFESIAEQRTLIAEAKHRTKAQRLANARSAPGLSAAPLPQAPPDDEPEPASTFDTDALPPFSVEDWS
jgi:putative transposase